MVQEKKGNVDFQDGGHHGFPIGMIFSYYFIYKLPRYFPPSFESIGLLVQEKKHKIAFQDGGHRGYLIGMTLAVFDPQVALILPTKFQVNWPIGSGEEA